MTENQSTVPSTRESCILIKLTNVIHFEKNCFIKRIKHLNDLIIFTTFVEQYKLEERYWSVHKRIKFFHLFNETSSSFSINLNRKDHR